MTTCERIWEWLHRELDGELPPDTLHELETHLDRCTGCREARAELRTLRESLRSLPVVPMPDAAFEEVLAGTSRRPHWWQNPAGWGLDWRPAAAAAALAALIWVGWPASQDAPTRTELAQAAAQARMIFKLTADAMEKTEQVVIRDVLAAEVSPALRKVPVQWPTRDESARRKSET